MDRSAYYEEMKQLARQTRATYGLTSPRVMKSDLRKIYKDNGLGIDLWPYPLKKLRGAYIDDGCGPPSVLLVKNLPPDPLIFTMAHELKHHLVDRGTGLSYCSATNETEPVEIGAEVFAAELIFPEQDFLNCLTVMEVTADNCSPEHLVRLKRETGTTLSYAGLAKRAEYFKFIRKGMFSKVKWKALEEQMYGVPAYKEILTWRRVINGL